MSRPQTGVFSCEFFPPMGEEATAKLRETRRQLERARPAFFSVTYGAGGTTRERTLDAVVEIQHSGTVEAAPHLTCIASTRDGVRAILTAYRAQGIRRIVALRGDLPSGAGPRAPGEFRFANELVGFIRAETGDHFHIEVAAYPEVHPQASSSTADLGNFKRKIEAGADSAITQYFYNADAYFRFVENCQKQNLSLPIVPGIMPITNYKQLARFSDACGAEIPRWLRKRLEEFGDDRVAIRAFGLEVVTDLCRRLLQGGAPGLHFYTMNQYESTLALWRNLNLPGAENLTP